ncbi:MAG: hypothetical protein FP820_06465 [Sulfurimonas sp.]|nr:hypothetical protein [Sulfurimonas sp.]
MDNKHKKVLADLLEKQHFLILERWRDGRVVQSVLASKKIDPDFFINHFGARVLNYFIGVLHNKNLPGQCPVISVMLNFFSRRGLMLDEVYQICSGMKNTIIWFLLEHGIKHSDGAYEIAVEIFDLNFAGVIKEYIEINFKQDKTNFIKEREKLSFSCPIDANGKEEKPLFQKQIDEPVLEEYFAEDTDDGEENIVFRSDDADDMLEYFYEIPALLSLVIIDSDKSKIEDVANIFSKTSSILLHYSPYLDSLAASMGELSSALKEHAEEFMAVMVNNDDAMLKLFDAVSRDMDRYIQRFSVESLAMKNSHHIHEPTTLSILQIISMFVPDQFEDTEIEFF